MLMFFPDTYTTDFNKSYEDKILEIAPEQELVRSSYNDEEILGFYYYDENKKRQIIRMIDPYEENLFYDMRKYSYGCFAHSCYFNYKLIPKEIQQSQNPEDALLVLYLLIDYIQKTFDLLQLIFQKLCEDAERIKDNGFLPGYFAAYKWDKLKSFKAGEISNATYQQCIKGMQRKIDKSAAEVQEAFNPFLDVFYLGNYFEYDPTNLLYYLAEKYGIKNSNFKISMFIPSKGYQVFRSKVTTLTCHNIYTKIIINP